MMKNKKLQFSIFVFLFTTLSCTAFASGGRIKIRTHIFKPGESLWNLSDKYYGNGHFSDIITLHNNIKDVRKLRAGLLIKVPDLKTLLQTERLYTVVGPEMDLILEAYRLIKTSTYIQFKSESPDSLAEASCLLEKAYNSIRLKKELKSPPKYMLRRLKRATELLRSLLPVDQRQNIYFSKHCDMVEQNIIFALYNGIIWARNGF